MESLMAVVPQLNDVKEFVNKLHMQGKYWKGEYLGRQAEYNPQSDEKPLDSNMQFTPANFWIGESGISFFSLMWEHGKDKPPVEFLDERGIIQPA